MKRLWILTLAIGTMVLCGCNQEAAVEPTPELSATKESGDGKATTSNQQLSINPDYKGK